MCESGAHVSLGIRSRSPPGFLRSGSTTGVEINGFPCKPAAAVSVNDFVFDGLQNPGNTDNPNLAAVTPANVNQFPGLNTLGISAARLDIAKGGVNPPHTHPRATEILLLVEGTVYAGFVTTSNTLFATVLQAGQLFVFPKGLVHFELNVGDGPAKGVGFLSSQNPGSLQIAPALFVPDIKVEVLEQGFRIDEQTVEVIQANFQLDTDESKMGMSFVVLNASKLASKPKLPITIRLTVLILDRSC